MSSPYICPRLLSLLLSCYEETGTMTLGILTVLNTSSESHLQLCLSQLFLPLLQVTQRLLKLFLQHAILHLLQADRHWESLIVFNISTVCVHLCGGCCEIPTFFLTRASLSLSLLLHSSARACMWLSSFFLNYSKRNHNL